MGLIKYLKEKKITYLFIISIFICFFIFYNLNSSPILDKVNASYIAIGWGILVLLFLIFDYGIFYSRFKKMKRYYDLDAPLQGLNDFSYPTDMEYAKLIREMVIRHERYKADLDARKTEDVELIAKGIHDIKAAITASRVVLEKNQQNMTREAYQGIDIGLFSMDQLLQRIFFELRINNLQNNYKVGQVSTQRLISRAVKPHANFFNYKKLNISVGGEVYNVLTDEKWCSYILSQIISNAIKYTPENGSVFINTIKTNNQITISIKNSGRGISERDIPHIFNKGYTSAEKRGGPKSAGYGLYLAKKLSDKLGHKLTVDSKHGEYAVFNLTFITKTRTQSFLPY